MGTDLTAPIAPSTRPLVIRRTCSHPGCTNEHSAKGKCRLHRQRERVGIAADRPVQRGQLRTRPKCEVEGCELVHYAFGKCRSHYLRARREASGRFPANDVKQPASLCCTVEGCVKRKRSQGLCYEHHVLLHGPRQRKLCEECSTRPAKLFWCEDQTWLCVQCVVELNTPAQKTKRKKVAA